jgi:hypothetical protein
MLATWSGETSCSVSTLEDLQTRSGGSDTSAHLSRCCAAALALSVYAHSNSDGLHLFFFFRHPRTSHPKKHAPKGGT